MTDTLAEQASLAAMRAYGLGENEIGNTLAACREALLGAEADKQLAVAAALRGAAKSLDAIMRDDLDSSGDPDFDAGFTEGARCCLEEILSMIPALQEKTDG